MRWSDGFDDEEFPVLNHPVGRGEEDPAGRALETFHYIIGSGGREIEIAHDGIEPGMSKPVAGELPDRDGHVAFFPDDQFPFLLFDDIHENVTCLSQPEDILQHHLVEPGVDLFQDRDDLVADLVPGIFGGGIA